MSLQFTEDEKNTLHSLGIYSAEALRDAYLKTRDDYLGQLFMKYLNIAFALRTELGLI